VGIARIVLVAVALIASLLTARADDNYPSRPITLIAPISPGTTVDILARLYADKLTRILGQTVIVMNKPGAGGVVGAEAVAHANADGYTLLFTNSGHAILKALNPDLQFDPVRDFAGVSMIGLAPAVVVVPANLGITDLKQFVAQAKAKPGTLNYGSAGIGSSTHLAGALFASNAGIDIVHVPYTTSANIISDMLSGAIQASFDPLAFVLSFVQNGKLRALAIGSDEPQTEPVQIPTASSQGVDYHYASWYGLLAPQKVSKPILQKLADAIIQANTDSGLLDKIKIQGIKTEVLATDRFDAYIASDFARLAPLIKGSGVKQ
jgi:tripartite-type tricarboxylate transporter receptor subunit TctC